MDIINLLFVTIPALIVFFTAFFSIRYYFKKEINERKAAIILDNQKLITPIRLQAYERLTILLERISPESIIMRVSKPGISSQQLHSEVLRVIRSEYEHNLSQQLYVSSKAWQIIKNAKENTIKIINTCATKVKPEQPALNLSQVILEKLINTKKSPTQAAIDFLKEEIKHLL